MLKVSNSHGVYQNEKMFFVKITKNKETFTFGPYETKKKAQFSYDRQREKMFNTGPYNFTSHLESENDHQIVTERSMERIDLTKHQTFKVCFKSSYHCNLCKNILIPGNFEIDHIIPLCCGGRNHYDNLQALCYTCHKFKTNIVDPRTRSKYMNKENINEANVIFLQTSLKIREDKGEII
jgi:5-methylcytosine-specific restriction endonuclease McrA